MSDTPEKFDDKAFLKTLTHQPGVYRMLNGDATILYVGKAKNLKKRVSSYFNRSGISPRIKQMIQQVAAMEFTVTNTEAEALLLENNLIKEYRPKYNILLRDDKTYPYILLSDNNFPSLSFYRGAKKKKGEYFGPYASVGAVRETLSLLQKTFKVRQCSESYYRNRSRPCLQYQIERCTAPCVNLVSEKIYAKDVDYARKFLQGKSEQVVNHLVSDMEKAAESLEFEHAAKLRDQIDALRQVSQQQYVSDLSGDCDIITCRMRDALACVQVFQVRNKMNLGNKCFFPKTPAHYNDQELLSAFIGQYYLHRRPPEEIIVSHEPTESDVLAEMLSNQREAKVKITSSVRGKRARWLDFAKKNVSTAFESRLASQVGMEQRFTALEDIFKLTDPIQRMECFDISHTSGELTVASCVVFNREGPSKVEYRKFNIEGITPGDDYAAMLQALTRRYKRIKKGEGKLPDILFIDGGKGQLTQAGLVMEELQVTDVLVVGVAKGVERKPGMEQLFILGDKQPIHLGGDSLALHLIQQIRDEAHRFAITSHRKRRDKSRTMSPLEGIAGLGPKRRQSLLKHFGGMRGIERASEQELAKVTGISKQLAQSIHEILHSH
jgi:excinuclease ABC subunit C|tara:strand:+ start:596 stop:2419 length:1824 start_codon:yes stop_codon:yes gene_type:complete